MGGSRGSTAKVVRNVFIIFIVSGFWHGANWTFIIWGALNALYFLPLLLFGKNRRNLDIIGQHRFPSIREIAGMVGTFGLTVIAWIFFRADSVGHALSILRGIVVGLDGLQTVKDVYDFVMIHVSKAILVFVVLFFLLEWFGRVNQYAIEKMGMKWSPILRRAFYVGIAIVIFLYGQREASFIYFQF